MKRKKKLKLKKKKLKRRKKKLSEMDRLLKHYKKESKGFLF